nr:MAG TPA: BppU domain protein [Caudoviricetes sp.]
MQKIRIDFDNPGLPQHISAVENDSQSRFFQATLYENGKAYTAPEGAAYSIMYRGVGPQNQGWYDTINDGAGKRAACAVSGNVVTCEIARQALQVPGHVSIVLCVTTGKGYMLKSWPIECDCKNDRYDSTAEIQSFFYVTQISNESWTQAIQAVEELKNTIDPTLSLSGKAADAAKVGEAVGELKEDYINVFTKTELLLRANKTKWLANQIDIPNIGEVCSLTVGNATTYSHLIISNPSDIYALVAVGGTRPAAYAWLDNEGKVISKADRPIFTGQTIIKPANAAKLVINNNNDALALTNAVVTDDANLIRYYKQAEPEINTQDNAQYAPSNSALSTVSTYAFASVPTNGIEWQQSGDLMVHVGTTVEYNNNIYCTYYANTKSAVENPNEQTARLGVYSNGSITTYDIQTVGDSFNGHTITQIYDITPILVNDKIYIYWAAAYDGINAKLYTIFDTTTNTFSKYNLANISYSGRVLPMTTASIKTLLPEYATKVGGDIGLMPTITELNGSHYTGLYAYKFNCIVSTTDFVTWDIKWVPPFKYNVRWENSVYVTKDIIYYCTRMDVGNAFQLLFKLDTHTFEIKEVYKLSDSNSKSCIFSYDNHIYVTTAPTNRYYLEIWKIDGYPAIYYSGAFTNECFYFYMHQDENTLHMTFTQERQKIITCNFDNFKYNQIAELKKLISK